MNAAKVLAPMGAQVLSMADARIARGLDAGRRQFGTGNRRYGTGNGGYTMSEGAVGSSGFCPPNNCSDVSGRRRKFANMRGVVTLLAPGPTATFIVTPQERFQIQCLMIPSSIGTAFTIDEISIGTHNQNVVPGTGALAQVFSEVAIPACGYMFDVICDIGIQIRLTVTNVSEADAEFFATFIGCSVDNCPVGAPPYAR